MSKCLEVFASELARIEDYHIREMVQHIFDCICPEYFWRIPASQRGHHPLLCRVPGGLVTHVKLAVRFADEFMDAWPAPNPQSRDEVLAAVLLHDMMKRGQYEDEIKTFASHAQACAAHGVYCADEIRDFMRIEENRCGVPRNRVNRIITAIRDHMGRWTQGYRRTQGDVERNILSGHIVCITTHMADYAASRSLDRWLAELRLDKSNPL